MKKQEPTGILLAMGMIFALLSSCTGEPRVGYDYSGLWSAWENIQGADYSYLAIGRIQGKSSYLVVHISEPGTVRRGTGELVENSMVVHFDQGSPWELILEEGSLRAFFWGTEDGSLGPFAKGASPEGLAETAENTETRFGTSFVFFRPRESELNIPILP